MNVEGIEIHQDVIDRALQWFPPDRSFTFADLKVALVRHGVPRETAYRASDRILQQCRKAGTHAYSGGKWKRVRITAGSS